MERFRRDLESCDSVSELRKIGNSLLDLYMNQQQAVEAMIKNDWLPPHDAP